MFTRKLSSLFLPLIVMLLTPVFFMTASAVSLPIQPNNKIDLSTHSSCTTATIAAIENSGNLQITGIPASCFGLNILSQAVRSDGDQGFSGTVTTSSITFPTTLVSPNLVVGVKTVIDGWNIPTTWTYNNQTSDPIAPNPSTPGITVTTSWNQTAATQFCVDVTISTTSSGKIDWLADISYLQPPFNGDSNTSNYQLSNNVEFVSNTPSNGVFTIRGTGSDKKVKTGSPIQFSICNYNAPDPAISPTANYSQTETTPSPSYWVCKTVTVAVTNAPFFVGWESTVDVTNLASNYLGAPPGSVKPPTGGFSTTQVSTYVFKVTGTGYNTKGVRNGSTVSYTICWGA